MTISGLCVRNFSYLSFDMLLYFGAMMTEMEQEFGSREHWERAWVVYYQSRMTFLAIGF